MKALRNPMRLVVILLASLCAAVADAQNGPQYEAQIQQGNAELLAGSADQALAAGEAAIRINPARWDGYALAGEAFLKLNRYEDAADTLSKAIDRAPQSEQRVLRDLRRQCLVAESGLTPATPAIAAPPAAAQPEFHAQAQSQPQTQSQPQPYPQPQSQSQPAVIAPPTAPPAAVAQNVPVASPARTASTVHSQGKGSREGWGRDGEPVWVASDGLMWARPWYYPAPTSAGPWNFATAQTFCARLDLLGYSNWRLPTLEEIQGVFEVSSKGWRWSVPKFDSGYGIDQAMKSGAWRPASFTINGDTFNGNRLLLWTSTSGDRPGEHTALYFGRRFSVSDELKQGTTLKGEHMRNPFQGYALCVRNVDKDDTRL